MFVYTTAINKLRKLKKRIRVVPGGTSAGKTFGILPILIDQAARTPDLEISVVSESVPHLKKGSLKDFKKIMRSTNRWIADHWHGTDMKYTFANNAYIEFFSADNDGKVHGPRRNVLYVNECNNIPFDIYHALAIRTDQDIWLDYNPTAPFWVNEELTNDEDAEWLTLTYKDNEALSESIVKEIEKAREKAKTSSFWANWWQVYGLGQIGSLEGVVYNNWSVIDEVPEEAELLGYGMDFGFSVDPTALVAVYRYDGEIIADQIIYKKGLLNSEIISLMGTLGVEEYHAIFADSAEPKTIEEIRRSGFAIKPVTKGSDSIRAGIQILQDYHFRVTKRSTDMIKELRNYTWDKNKSGEELKKPIDAFNHALDAFRYFAMMKLKKDVGFWSI